MRQFYSRTLKHFASEKKGTDLTPKRNAANCKTDYPKHNHEKTEKKWGMEKNFCENAVFMSEYFAVKKKKVKFASEKTGHAFKTWHVFSIKQKEQRHETHFDDNAALLR